MPTNASGKVGSLCVFGYSRKAQQRVDEARLKSLRRYAGIISAASIPPIILFSSRFARTVMLSHLLRPVDLGAAVALATIYGTCEFLPMSDLTSSLWCM